MPNLWKIPSDAKPLVLFVDDDETMRLIAQASLTQAGFDVHICVNGWEAVEFCKQTTPSIIMLDIMMPVLDGYRTCQELRKLPNGAYIPIVMVTGLDDVDSIHRAYDAGATDFITKPINYSLVNYRIHYILRANLAIQELHRSEQKHLILLRAIPDSILRLNKNGIILDVKPSSDETRHWSRSIRAGDKVDRFFPRHVSLLIHHHMENMDPTDTAVVETELRHNDDIRDLEIRILFSGPDEFIAIVRDITEAKHLEREILEFSRRERLRIGQELHDGLGQQLTGISFLSRVLHKKLSARSMPESFDAEEILNLVKQTIAQTKAMARGLVPIEMEESTLCQALDGLVNNMRDLYEKSITLTCADLPPLHASNATQIYYIAQEALRNSLQYSQASWIRIQLEIQEDHLHLTVSDDGVGIDETDRNKGTGLRIMNFRARMLGAQLNVSRNPKGGTVVRCIIPLLCNAEM